MSECPPGVHSMFDFCPGDCTDPVVSDAEQSPRTMEIDMSCPCEHPCHPVDCCGNCHTAIGPWCADWEPSPRRIEIDVTCNCSNDRMHPCVHDLENLSNPPPDRLAGAIQALRYARPDPYTCKASFLLGWDAAIAALERMK